MSKTCKRGGKFGPLIGKKSKLRCLSYLMLMVSHPFDFSLAHLAFTLLTEWRYLDLISSPRNHHLGSKKL